MPDCRYIRIFALAAAASILPLASCTTNPVPAGSAAQAHRACFAASQVNSFSGNADGTVDIKVGSSQFYRLTTDGTCPDIAFKTQIGIRATAGGDFVCNGYDSELIVSDPMGPQRCHVTAIAPITRETYLAARSR